MDDNQRNYLNKYIKENQIEDTTEKIRKEKQSTQLKIDIKKIFELRTKYRNEEQFLSACEKKCSFLKSKQPKLYEKLTKKITQDTLRITNDMINLLDQIENSHIDQNEASYKFGMLCKELYIDPVISNKSKTKQITWSEFKDMKADI